MSVGIALAFLLVIYVALFRAYLPNTQAAVGADYSLWLPDLMAGYFWHLQNTILDLPWFSPSQCGGIPFFADPQVGYLSVPQFLTFIMPPLEAVQSSALLYAAIGFVGSYWLSRSTFCTSVPAALLAGTLFMFNEFYTARMLVGHLTYQPFMLAPFLAATVIPRRSQSRHWQVNMLGACIGGLLVAVMIEAGAIHVVPPVLLSVAILGVMQSLRLRSSIPTSRFLFAIVVGCALAASKLAASSALVANFPRDQYSLPGIPGFWLTLGCAIQSVFIGPPAHPEMAVLNSVWALQRHEWEYSVSIVPVVLMALWAIKEGIALRRPVCPKLWAVLATLLLIPIALNWYEPGWNAFLKSLPFIGSSSNLLRWFAAYILPASLVGALALDGIVPKLFRPAGVSFGIAVVVTINFLTDRSFYGQAGQGVYQFAALEASWHAAAEVGAGPRITSIGVLRSPQDRIAMTPKRQDAFTLGYSQLFCYEPLFGYNLERFPIGTLHPGLALARKAGLLNVKNPACYVFPASNDCVPGDQFPESRIADAQAFLDYRPFPFNKPLWAQLADLLGMISGFILGFAVPVLVWIIGRNDLYAEADQ